jgi:hypothetical protein
MIGEVPVFIPFLLIALLAVTLNIQMETKDF